MISRLSKSIAVIGLAALVLAVAWFVLQADLFSTKWKCVVGGTYNTPKTHKNYVEMPGDLVIFSCENPRFAVTCDVRTVERFKQQWKCKSKEGKRFNLDGYFEAGTFLKLPY